MDPLVNKFKPSGSGTPNDVNAARRCFKNDRESARITGVNGSPVLRIYVILQIISSRFEINIEEFNQYTNDTAKLFVKEYPWFHVPASVVKILVHGADIVSGATIYVGQFSEEAEESRNKERKYCRRIHSRKICRS